MPLCAPYQTPSQSATPTIRTQPTPAIPQPRGVEDAAPYGREENHGISIVVNKCTNPANIRPRLRSTERGAVAAHCAMTEGLVQRGCGVPALPVDRRRERAWRWGGAWNRRRRSSNGGAPGTVRPTTRDVTLSNNPTSSAIQRKGRRGRRPLRWLRDAGFSGAVRHSLPHLLRFMPQARLRCCM